MEQKAANTLLCIKFSSKRITVPFLFFWSWTGTLHRLLTFTHHWISLTIVCIVWKNSRRIPNERYLPVLCSQSTHSLCWLEDYAKNPITVTTHRRLIFSDFNCKNSHREERLVNLTVEIIVTALTILCLLTAAGQTSEGINLVGQNWFWWDCVFFSRILESIESQCFNRLPFLIIRRIERLYYK